MSFITHEISLPSTDGKHRLYAEIHEPADRAPIGVVQICHGMVDHIGRYKRLGEYLTDNGYIFAGHCHLGHGKTANGRDELGFFAEKNGADIVVKDVGVMNAYLRDRYPTLPITLLGHSMGSFIARLYAKEHPKTISGLIIHGTGGPNPAVPLGKALVSLISLFRGKRHRSGFVKAIAFMGYNSRFPKEEGTSAWLSRDPSVAEEKAKDEYGNFTFTLSAYKDLFRFVGTSNSKKCFDAYLTSLPTLIVSGEDDPVGGFGKGVRRVYSELYKRGVKDLSLKLYPGARHELFNELNSEEIFGDIVAWLSGVRE